METAVILGLSLGYLACTRRWLAIIANSFFLWAITRCLQEGDQFSLAVASALIWFPIGSLLAVVIDILLRRLEDKFSKEVL